MGWFFHTGGISLVFQVLMLVHFFRNRPEGYWFFVIVFFGPIGAMVYLFVEVLPGWNWKLPAIAALERRRRKQWLQKLVAEAPSQEARAELAKLVALEGDTERAYRLFTESLERDPDDLESLYGRGKAAQRLGNQQQAVADLTKVVEEQSSFDFHQAALSLAESYEQLGQETDAERVYRDILGRTTVSGAYYGLGALLARNGRTEEARRLFQEVLSKQNGLPRYLRRQERPWVRKTKAALKTLSAGLN